MPYDSSFGDSILKNYIAHQQVQNEQKQREQDQERIENEHQNAQDSLKSVDEYRKSEMALNQKQHDFNVAQAAHAIRQSKMAQLSAGTLNPTSLGDPGGSLMGQQSVQGMLGQQVSQPTPSNTSPKQFQYTNDATQQPETLTEGRDYASPTDTRNAVMANNDAANSSKADLLQQKLDSQDTNHTAAMAARDRHDAMLKENNAANNQRAMMVGLARIAAGNNQGQQFDEDSMANLLHNKALGKVKSSDMTVKQKGQLASAAAAQNIRDVDSKTEMQPLMEMHSALPFIDKMRDFVDANQPDANPLAAVVKGGVKNVTRYISPDSAEVKNLQDEANANKAGIARIFEGANGQRLTQKMLEMTSGRMPTTTTDYKDSLRKVADMYDQYLGKIDNITHSMGDYQRVENKKEYEYDRAHMESVKLHHKLDQLKGGSAAAPPAGVDLSMKQFEREK
jgi:hypothetical protein